MKELTPPQRLLKTGLPFTGEILTDYFLVFFEKNNLSQAAAQVGSEKFAEKSKHILRSHDISLLYTVLQNLK